MHPLSHSHCGNEEGKNRYFLHHHSPNHHEKNTFRVLRQHMSSSSLYQLMHSKTDISSHEDSHHAYGDFHLKRRNNMSTGQLSALSESVSSDKVSAVHVIRSHSFIAATCSRLKNPCETCQHPVHSHQYLYCQHCPAVVHNKQRCLDCVPRKCPSQELHIEGWGESRNPVKLLDPTTLDLEEVFLSATIAGQWNKCYGCGCVLDPKYGREMTSEKDSAKSQSEVKDVPTSALTAINQTMSRLSNPSQSSHPESGRIRICHLTGKYYCGRCHWDDQWYIPGSIFLLNDASLQPLPLGDWKSLTDQPHLYGRVKPEMLTVECFIRRLSRQAYLKLRVLWDSAIYRVPDYWHTENPEAAKVFKLRTEFHRMLNYCLMCSGAAAVKAASELVVPVHLLGYPHYMRMYDVIETLEGRLLPKLESELKLWTEHMSSCEACSRRSSYLDDALSIDTKEEENDIAQISWTNSGLENENYP